MEPTADAHAPSFFARWVGATFAGWFIGVLLVVLFSIAGDAAGLGKVLPGGQYPVGIAMGAAVGFAQLRVARAWFGATSAWAWAALVGMGAPFVASDLLRISGRLPLWLALDVAVGALLTGAWQARSLRPRAGAACRWLGASLAGWLLAAGVAALAGTRAAYRLGVGGVLFNIGVILFGGVALGAVTGQVLERLLRSPRAAQPAPATPA